MYIKFFIRYRLADLLLSALLIHCLPEKFVNPAPQAARPSDRLVVYFSRSGHTETAAMYLARRYKADLIEIPDNRYSLDFMGSLRANCDSIAGIAAPGKQAGIDYKKIKTARILFLGFPIWYWKPAPPLLSFIRAANLEKKRIVLFFTMNSGYSQDALAKFRSEIEDRGGSVIATLPVRRGRFKPAQGEELERIIENYLLEFDLEHKI